MQCLFQPHFARSVYCPFYPSTPSFDKGYHPTRAHISCLANMGDSNIRQGLLAAVKGDDHLVAFPDKLLFQFHDAKPYNIDIPITPAAVTYPKTAEQVAEIVRYASAAGLKVQARSGGHSYGNHGNYSLCPAKSLPKQGTNPTF
jgi:hypothetical protein